MCKQACSGILPIAQAVGALFCAPVAWPNPGDPGSGLKWQLGLVNPAMGIAGSSWAPMLLEVLFCWLVLDPCCLGLVPLGCAVQGSFSQFCRVGLDKSPWHNEGAHYSNIEVVGSAYVTNQKCQAGVQLPPNFVKTLRSRILRFVLNPKGIDSYLCNKFHFHLNLRI